MNRTPGLSEAAGGQGDGGDGDGGHEGPGEGSFGRTFGIYKIRSLMAVVDMILQTWFGFCESRLRVGEAHHRIR